MKISYSIIALCFAQILSAQTKLISYKSHSADVSFFHKELETAATDLDYSNLGAAPQKEIKTSKLDSVIFINDKKSVVVTSSTCRFRGSEKWTKWKPGRDTVSSNSIFVKRNIDSVRKVLKENYYFKNNMDSVVFVQYNAESKKYVPVESKGIEVKEEKKNELPSYLLYIGVIAISSLSGLYTWRRNKKENEKQDS